MSTDKGTSGRHPRPNLVLTAKREQRGWLSRRKAVRELHKIWTEHLPSPPDLESLAKALYRHETGRAQVRDETYRKLYCLAYNASPHELFGSVTAENAPAAEFRVRSHKFIPAFVGVEAAKHLAVTGDMRERTDQWFECHSGQIPVSDGRCNLYVWPFGIAVFHLVEELAPSSLAALAVWRVRSYQENLAWATDQLRTMLQGDDVTASYVLSLYWLQEPAWSGDTLDIALRILSVPKVLLERHTDPTKALGHAELVEQTLLAEGFDHPEIIPFGIKGISAGQASWSGVVYHPLAEQRALTEAELVACELAVQSLWAYCDHLNGQVEEGRDPIVPDAYGWRFLRAARSRLTNPRPQENEQHRSMRNAILATCGIVNHLAHAIDTLRETDGG